MTVKLIATDLDATFLRPDKSFNHELYRQMMAAAAEQEVAFVVATGNHPDKIAGYFAGLPAPQAVIANNGAQVMLGDQLLATQNLDSVVFQPILDLINDHRDRVRMGLVFTGTKRAFMLKQQAALGLGTEKAATYFEDLVLIDDLSEIDEPILKLTVDLPDYERPFMAAVRALDLPVHVTSAGYGAIDFVNPDVNKAVGLRLLSEQMQIAPAEMAAFGDGLNDVEMLNLVGQPYRMPVADPLLRAAPYAVAVAGNEADGVLQTILTEILGRQS
ncbi:HAD family hydrolase [Leuconostocaceae bacterium ESL0958]|nr:HAD family hydrolase [Leuconostocaceae bacterium ESL0958]